MIFPGVIGQQQLLTLAAGGGGFPTSGLTSYWRLDETSGSTAADQQGINTANIDGSPTRSTDSKLGGRCIDFTTGSSPRMRTGIQLGSGGSFTAACWVKRAAVNDNRVILSRQRYTGNVNDQHYMYLIHRTDRGGLTLQYDNRTSAQSGAAQFVDAGQLLTSGAYSLTGLDYNPGTNTVQIWIDGVKKAEQVLASPGSGMPGFEATTAELMFGNRISNYSSLAWDGKIDEPFVFNRVLTQGEWDTIYNSGAGLQY